jgi:hypothetical protein
MFSDKLCGWLVAATVAIGVAVTAGQEARAGGGRAGGKMSSGLGRTPIKTPSSQGRFNSLKSRVGSQFGVQRPYQEHHMIPYSLKEHPAVTKSGLNINSRQNVIVLPTDRRITAKEVGGTRSVHRGGHSTQRMKQTLDRIDRIGTKRGWDRETYREALDRVLFRERQGLRSGETPLNKNQR